MGKYIDAELLPILFNEKYKGTLEMIQQGETHLYNIAEGFLEAYQVILKMPAADVRENVRGEWICKPKQENLFSRICSNCKHYSPVGFYCINCGADMRTEWG